MIILHFHLQPQFKNELFRILHIVVFVVVIYVYATLNPKIMHILLLHVTEMMGCSFAWLISHHLQQIRYELHYYHPVYTAQLDKRSPGLPSRR